MGSFPADVVIVPEDRANEQIAIGFRQHMAVDDRRLTVDNPAGGWGAVCDHYEHVLSRELDRRPLRFLILLIDFDNSDTRFEHVSGRILPRHQERVFVIGVLSEPEQVKREFGSYASLGNRIAGNCDDGITEAWQHALLSHNLAEVQRMTPILRPILFGT